MLVAFRLIAGGLCLAVLARLGAVVWSQLWFPFDLVFETPNLSTIQLLRAGIDPYAETTFADFPFNLTLYPPLYHLLVAALPSSGSNPFLSGRLVALAAMLAAAATLFAVRPGQWVLPALGVAVFFCLPAAISNSAFLKNDPLALCLSGWALVAISRSGDRRWAHLVAALLLVLAMATKQSYAAALLACGAFLLFAQRSKLLEFGLAFAGLLGTLGMLAHLRWGAGFWFSTLAAPANPMDWGQTARLLGEFLSEPLFALLAVTSFASALAGLRGGALTRPTHSPFFLYVVFSGALLVLTVGKIGASTNYFFEFLLAQALWLVDARNEDSQALLARPASALALGALAAGVALSLATTDFETISFAPEQVRENRMRAAQQWRDLLRAESIERPTVLNLETHLFTRETQERAVFSDPFLYRILWRTGVLDNGPMLAALRRHAFDIVITRSGLPASLSGDLPNRQIEAEVLARYRLWRRGAYGDYYRPR